MSQRFKLSFLSLTLVMGLSVTDTPASAQWFIPGDPEDWKASVGLGAGIRPDYPGAKNLVATPVPFIDVTYKKRFFLNSGRGLGTFLYGDKDGRLKYMLGVAVGPSFESRSRKDVPGLPKVGMTAAARAFGEVFFDSWSFETVVSKDMIGEGHEGMSVDLGLNYTHRVKETGLVRIGPQLRYVSGDYMDSFYTVTPQQSALSGLSPFNAGSGIDRVGGRAYLSYPIAKHWNIVGLVSYHLLIADAANSPVSRTRHQIGLYSGLSYRF